MKIAITIQQKQFFKYADKNIVLDENGKEIVLDLVDLSLFDYLFYVINSDWVSKTKIENKTFAWISYKKIIDDNPQLRISNKNNIARRLKKLVKYGLLESILEKEGGNRTYFYIPTEIYEYFSVGYNKNKDTIYSKDDRVSTEKETPLSTFGTNNSYIKEDSNIKDSFIKETSKDKSFDAKKVSMFRDGKVLYDYDGNNPVYRQEEELDTPHTALVLKIMKYVVKSLPAVARMQRPLSFIETEKLVKKYDSDSIVVKLQAMENLKNLNRKYKSTYFTLNNWLKK